jgi:hypothetical protein
MTVAVVVEVKVTVATSAARPVVIGELVSEATSLA